MTTTDPAVAALIREVLAEELARLRAGVREERVRIGDDADLAAFARQVLAIADDRAAREALENGRAGVSPGFESGTTAGVAGAGTAADGVRSGGTGKSPARGGGGGRLRFQPSFFGIGGVRVARKPWDIRR